ncbi:MAG: YhbY family RNA-binding protein [Clostridiales bacterium]|nr:YhbY family RNA-binding protein [Clostridiales bacterium]
MNIITNENITSKQRSKLKSLAANLSPITQIGKGGITDNLLKTLSDALEAREIIKVHILETADDDVRNLADNVAELLDAVPVAVIGRKAIFYRYSSRQNFAHLEI